MPFTVFYRATSRKRSYIQHFFSPAMLMTCVKTVEQIEMNFGSSIVLHGSRPSRTLLQQLFIYFCFNYDAHFQLGGTKHVVDVYAGEILSADL